MKKLFFGFTAVESNDYKGNELAYKIEFRNTQEVDDFYEMVKANAFKTNFNANPREQYSFAHFYTPAANNELVEWHVGAPQQSNGDSNWWSYPANTKRYAYIINQINN